MAMELKYFKAAFDRICHAALWTIMRKYNINANLVCAFESLYEKATSAVQLNGNTRELFRTTFEGWPKCLLSPTFFNIFLERITSGALEEYVRKVSKIAKLLPICGLPDAGTRALAESTHDKQWR